MKHRTVILAVIALVGCGGGSATSESAEPAASTTEASSNNARSSSGGEAPTASTVVSAQPTVGGDGTAFERPIETCGAGESYQRIANFVCPEGDMPLHGDVGLGARARLGSSSAHMAGASIMDSHMVDIYQVPCASGAREVFVCLYHCGPGASPYD
jgi:hypothetical protein